LVRALVVVLAAVVVGFGWQYRDQMIRYATHLKGSPTGTVPWTPFPAGERPELHVAVAGDVGDSGRRLAATAEAISELDARQPLDALALLGDNVYPTGDPAKLDDTVFTPFAGLLRRGVELDAVLGNHDVIEGHAARQVAALGLPGRWWARHEGDVLTSGWRTRPSSPAAEECAHGRADPTGLGGALPVAAAGLTSARSADPRRGGCRSR
jgi:hypothetical protein